MNRLCQTSQESRKSAQCFGAHLALNYAQAVEKAEAAQAKCIGPPPGSTKAAREAAALKAKMSLLEDNEEGADRETAQRSLDIVHPTELGALPPRDGGGQGAGRALHYGLARVSRRGRELASSC